MKRYSFVIAVLASFLSACTSSPVLQLKNNTAKARKDAPVVISRVEIQKLTGEIPNEKFPVVTDEKGTVIPSQIDDLDRDGKWDELALVCDFEAKEVKKLNVNFVSYDKIPEYTVRTNVRLGVGSIEGGFEGVDHAVSPKGFTGVPISYQAESVSWENDLMGFRDYFDCRNAKDLFGKLQPEMIMDNIGTKESTSYHELSSWGMDILHVGPSLGAGGLALFHQDSLYRLGSTDKFEFQLVTKGPVRSVFELNYGGWNVDGKSLSAQEKITVWAGKYWFQSDVTVGGLDEESELAVGIVTSYLKEKKPFSFTANNQFEAIATHDIQSMNNDCLAMGVLFPSDSKVRIGDAPVLSEEVSNGSRWNQPVGLTHFVTQKINNNKSATHYFFAAWELENKKWAEQENFKNLMKSQADELSSPVVVSIK
ncbi:hypothetical protein BZG01_01215 [Labilibaculum manganireducens]|uniref:DUF4861 domain-containing protein n=1 Tax=Labilibaculum manganireducens TaxID=1940525 RepID=A0A2N3IH05_9BACT|nr:DUF4861 domain-containing protein [Labilibaculum manganireducens]PKQ69571.1 hypothetical protein BZG01_01215 [Labilibaculum manganireducens]